MHLRSKVSSDGRIVVPRTVGKRLNPGPDDYVHFIVEARSVRFLWKHRRTRTIHSATFSEWVSTADEEAYADL